MRERWQIAGLYVLAVATPAAAQNEAQLAVPGEVQGQLAEGDQRTSDNAFFDDYAFHLGPRQRVQISVQSNNFDTLLVIYRPGASTEPLASDDDGGGGLNSRLTFSSPEGGDFAVRVTSFDAGGTGAYTLRASVAGIGRARDLPAAGTRMAWSTVEGRLTARAGSVPEPVFDEYRLRLQPGQEAIIRLASTDFDPYVLLYLNGTDSAPVATDDDSGDGLNSLLVFQAPTNGPPVAEYVIRVQSLSGSQSGAYTLRVGR